MSEATVIWRDGETWRTDIFGRWRRMPQSIPADDIADLIACRPRIPPAATVPVLEEVEL